MAPAHPVHGIHIMRASIRGMSFECQFIFSPWSIVQLFDEFRALGQSLTIGFDLAGKRLRLNQDAKFVAVADTHPGEVGAAEEDLVAVHQNDLLVHGAVFLDKANVYTICFKGLGIVERGVADGHGGAFAEFGDDKGIQTRPGFLADGVINCLDGFVAAAADEIGQNPDTRVGRLNGFLHGLAEGFGRQEADSGGIAGLEPAGDTVEIEVGARFLRGAIDHIAHGSDGDVGHHERSGCLDQGSIGIRGLAHDVAGENGSIAQMEGVELGRGNGGEAKPYEEGRCQKEAARGPSLHHDRHRNGGTGWLR